MRSISSPHQSSPSLHSTGKSGLNPRTFPSAMLASPPASDRKWAPTVGTPAASSGSTSLKRSGTRLLLFRDNFTWVWRGAVQLTVFDYRLFFFSPCRLSSLSLHHHMTASPGKCLTKWSELQKSFTSHSEFPIVSSTLSLVRHTHVDTCVDDPLKIL